MVESDLSALGGRHFDVVVDTAGYFPSVVAASVEALRAGADRYVFVSSVSVYADQTVPPVEGAGLLADDSYGGRKAACERVVLDGFGDRALIARPGLITGPHDPTERVAYWPRRFARGGRVLAPGDPLAPVQFIDVRDLAGWLVSATASGVFNTVGPGTPMAEVLDACRRVAEVPAEVVWVSDPARGRLSPSSGRVVPPARRLGSDGGCGSGALAAPWEPILIVRQRTPVETIAYACHTAYLNPLTGSGLLVRPRPELDLRTTGLAPSLHEADWNHAMRDLDARGWEPTESERGAIAVDSYMPDGREVIGLHGRHPIIAEPTIEQELESFAELRRLAGSA